MSRATKSENPETQSFDPKMKAQLDLTAGSAESISDTLTSLPVNLGFGFRASFDSDADSGRSRSVLGLNFSFAPFKVGQCTFAEEKISFKASGHRFVQTDSHFWAK